MNYFLAKSEPSTYSIDHLEREGQTPWNGIKNPQALTAIKAMQKGDLVFMYHSGGECCVVGLMKVISVPRPDPKIEKSWMVDVEFVCKYHEPMKLHQIKASHLFDDFKLVRQGRLSTMAVPEKFVKWIKERGYKVK